MEKIKSNSDTGYIKAVRSIDSVITFKTEYIKLLQQEIELHQQEKNFFMDKHNTEVLQPIETAENVQSTNMP